MRTATRRRAPQCLATTIRKVEPMGAGMVRLYFAVEQDGTWDDRAVIEMPCVSIASNFAFAVDAVRAIAADPDANPEPTKLGLPYLGTVN
ncbi:MULTISPECIES: hypothetical protein [unclassified Bradyrhizobium]|uniref:hypothetical protein n=1 Tax=Bradyrhizobium sp. USDA 4541 TaxID=2817704 RepID=UPI0020A2DEC6|nr:hypothetical protein [Bradyrhizobium sp. USDA 4541]MCP1851215.1 hypothetical protein [Bradyrhizobium sp. USDA 4541]